VATKARPSFNKRQKERERQERRKKKLERRAQRQADRRQGSDLPSGENPEVGSIAPGEPPRPEEF
jgi:hypothetical protein